MSTTYDNWERLVAATLKREQFRQLALAHSRESSFSSIQSDFSFDSPLYSDPGALLSDSHDSTARYEKVPRLPNMCNSSARSNISIPFSSVKSSAASLPTPRSEIKILSSPYVKVFSFNELKCATRNFRPDSFLGEGGFGYVFKGWIDEHTLAATKPGSGLVIAVKKLKPEWLTEVNYLGQLHHTNLVKLIGYCSEADNRLLVYEFMPRGSLENHLFRRGPQPLSWVIRMKVAIGAARGLSFLHEAEEQVIYKDFKASNILLDGEFNAKLSDFGLAKAQVPKAIKLTQLPKLLVRVAMLRQNMLPQNLVEWATPYLADKRKLFRIMDSKMEGQYPQKAAFSVAAISLQCICNETKLRPRMAEVLATLEKLQA